MTRSVHTLLSRSLSQVGTERALPRARAELDRLGTQLATGYRIQRPSDDPSGYTQAKALGRLQERLAQYGRGIDAASLWVDRTQVELDGLADLFSEAHETGLRAANGVLDAEEMALQIESVRDEVIARLNATSAGEHLFAGNQTTTPPVNGDGTLAGGDVSGRREREVAPGVRLAINTVGALEVDGVGAPERLQALADAIRAGDRDAIAGALDGVDAGVKHYISLGARNGTVARNLQNARAAIESQDLVVGEQRAAIEEVDLAEVMGAIQRRQTGLEAALRATASTVQQTLLDYLR